MHVSVFSGALRYVANGNGGLSGQERTRQFRLREILFCFLNGKVFFLYVDFTGQEIVQKCPDEGDAEKFDQTFDIGIDRRIQDIGGKLEFERQQKPATECEFDRRIGGRFLTGFHGDADSQDETGENTNCRSGFQYELQNADCTDKLFLQKSDIHDGESPGSFEKR